MNATSSIARRVPLWTVAVVVLSCTWLPTVLAAAERVGIYDSRAVAYAHFWDATNQANLRARVADAERARENGEIDEFDRLTAGLAADQRRVHLQVFSTEGVDDILAGMTSRLAEIRSEAGVTWLVSKWDTDALRAVKGAELVDITALLIREFALTDKQRRTLANLLQRPPLPLAEARRLLEQDKL